MPTHVCTHKMNIQINVKKVFFFGVYACERSLKHESTQHLSITFYWAKANHQTQGWGSGLQVSIVTRDSGGEVGGTDERTTRLYLH